ncbi:SAM-dependent methyltransferase [Metabacillus crassostreae]|uniref:class I SAM-dependent DNA methyltransferase n=1 Tax=Metabacillus crassostreae TaxID=929098 RepID=UPI00195D57CB|nr:class I SAM-dependent methyltransferase [Metabacillus crassostreae]MBM7604770.1 SAM-dependent methyltransferase [Metabacillus crassostreae]
MIYQGFAYIYDQLMKDAPYDQWAELILEVFSKYHPDTKNVLDIGCGTGEIAVRLAKKQFNVTGVDLSEDMLTVAQAKAEKNKVNMLFLQQDMRELTGFIERSDAITICCDSLNYLRTISDVQSTFEAVYNQLNDNGLFIFDVHSLYKIHNVFADATFADQDDDISFIWSSYLGEEEHSIEHDLSFFVKQGEFYERYDELHYQRTFDIEQYKQLLQSASFEIVKICSDFQLHEDPTPTTERIFFIARKK